MIRACRQGYSSFLLRHYTFACAELPFPQAYAADHLTRCVGGVIAVDGIDNVANTLELTPQAIHHGLTLVIFVRQLGLRLAI